MKPIVIIAILLTGALPVLKTGACPSGYFQSGGYCAPMSDKSPTAIPKVGSCPSGWRQSGAYCVENQPRR
jgi:hypothetical protein